MDWPVQLSRFVALWLWNQTRRAWIKRPNAPSSEREGGSVLRIQVSISINPNVIIRFRRKETTITHCPLTLSEFLSCFVGLIFLWICNIAMTGPPRRHDQTSLTSSSSRNSNSRWEFLVIGMFCFGQSEVQIPIFHDSEGNPEHRKRIWILGYID